MLGQLDRHDLAGVLALCAPDATFYGFAPEPLDRAGYQQNIAAFLAAFPDSRFILDDLVAEADQVAVRHTFTGTPQGEFQGLPAGGRCVTTSGMLMLRIVNGQVKDCWLNADSLGLLRQLGAVLEPAPTPTATPLAV
jgi:hypothetical protein